MSVVLAAPVDEVVHGSEGVHHAEFELPDHVG